MSNEIPGLSSNAHVERSVGDPARRRDPYAERRNRQRPPKKEPAAPEAVKAKDEGTGTPEDSPRIIGSRLDVRA